MNRQQRRLKQQAKEKVSDREKLNYKIMEAIMKEKANLKMQALQENINDYCTIMAWVLVEEFGFGKKRVERFCDRFVSECKCIGSDYVDLSDIRQVLDEKDIVIK